VTSSRPIRSSGGVQAGKDPGTSVSVGAPLLMVDQMIAWVADIWPR
jgi:hypothetical protein